MPKVLLEVRKDWCTGEVGLCCADMPHIEDAPSVDSMKGVLIAHDLIEHPHGAGNIGGRTDECQALGAALYGRGFEGRLQRDGFSMYSVEENLASDIARMFREAYCREELDELQDHNMRLSDEWDWDFIEEKALKSIRSEEEYEEPEYRSKHSQRIEFVQRAIKNMQIGVRKAHKRFGSRAWCHKCFWAIADAVEPCAEHCEFEGQQYMLEFSIKHGTASCSEHYEFDEDY